MSDITEAIGTATEGGLWSRVMSRKSGKLTDKDGNSVEKGHFAEGACLNCGAALAGEYCHRCGQRAHLHRTIGAFLHDLLHGALHLDGKVWRTLPMLAFRPGQLTRRYIEGERARFVSPMALFLFSVFLMFAVFQLLGISTPTTMPSAADAQQTITQLRETAENEQARLREQADALPEGSPERARLEQRLDEAESVLGEVTGPDAPFDLDDAAVTVNLTGVEAIDNGLIAKWRENPGLMLYKLQANGYKFSWLLIPLSLPFVWLLFAWKRRFKAYDHAIFVTYSIAFMSLLFIALSLLAITGAQGAWAFTLLVLIPPVHIYKQLRGAYQLSRFSAAWRTLLLIVLIAFAILPLFLWTLLLLGAF